MSINADGNLLAVYGTLKYGYYNHTKYLKGSRPIYEGYIRIEGVLITNGSYPLLLENEHSSQIYIEVYSVSQEVINELDALEAPYDLHRKKILILGLEKAVDIYIGSVIPFPEGFTIVKDGNWHSTKPFVERE